MHNMYSWQKEAIEKVKNKNAVISAPTGSGKTLVAYHWAGLLDESYKKYNKIIFTAPIKALSNERYRELKKMFPKEVGIETGDIKKNIDKKILCCTQEIYTLKYATEENQKVVVDEFHFVVQDSKRARNYIDGILNTSIKSNLLVMSATFGDPEKVAEYLQKLTQRNFILYHTDFRPTSQIFLKEEVVLEDIAKKQAIVFLFSYRGVEGFAEELSEIKDFISPKAEQWLRNEAKKRKINLQYFPFLFKGVGVYHGGLLPKEKFFIEEAFRKGYIQQIVGTDALALGVNLPAEAVYFGQLAKYYDGPISKNEFLQMAGRAGRKGFFNTGYVGYITTRYENFEYSTSYLYYSLLEKEQEKFSVRLEPDWKKLLLRQTSPEKEATTISVASIPSLEEELLLEHIKEQLNRCASILEEKGCSLNEFGEVFFSEFSFLENLNLFSLLWEKKIGGEFIVVEEFCSFYDAENANGKLLNHLLQIRRWFNNLPKKYQKIFEKNFCHKLEHLIKRIDESVLNI